LRFENKTSQFGFVFKTMLVSLKFDTKKSLTSAHGNVSLLSIDMAKVPKMYRTQLPSVVKKKKSLPVVAVHNLFILFCFVVLLR